MPPLLLLLACVIGCSGTHPVFAQGKEPASFIFLPGKLLSPPLTASYQEPRVGVRKQLSTSRLKIDIGASIDMLEFRPGRDSLHRIRLGIDFFTYALSTNAEGLRLQIDAVDGFFGGHIAYLHDLDETRRFTLRLRLLHLSAHFLDGHFNSVTQTWKDNRAPLPFTRDYGELIGMYRFGSSLVRTMAYAGFSYATLLRPTDIRRFEYHVGIEWFATLGGPVFGQAFNLYLCNHLTVRGIPSYIGSNNAEFGVKFGAWQSTGLKVYMSYYNGLDAFSQYYDVRRHDLGIGVAFDFW